MSLTIHPARPARPIARPIALPVMPYRTPMPARRRRSPAVVRLSRHLRAMLGPFGVQRQRLVGMFMEVAGFTAMLAGVVATLYLAS
ncbi:MAG: hypothetical protein FJX76_10750 [Armatimonadetes bacterium]|nr:hypothetical protein [Armatimonadota bacterium]